MKEKTIKTDHILKGRLFDIYRLRVRLSNGRESFREIIKHPGAIAVIPVLDDGRILLERQYRKAVEKVLYEIPAGTLEKGETLEDCVRRELLEETGYAARKVAHLISFYPAPGYTSEQIHLFVAQGLTLSKACPEEDETIVLAPLKIESIMRLIRSGKIKDGKTILAMLYLQFFNIL